MRVWNSTFLRNIAGTLVRQLASGGLQLLLVILIGRVFGPSGNGVYAVALLLPTLLVTFLNFGVSTANIYYLASREVDLRTSFLVSAFLALVCGLSGLAIGAVMLAGFGETLFPGVEMRVLMVALAAFPFLLMLQFVGGLLQGLQDFRAFNLTLLVPSFVTLAAAGLLVVLARLDLFSLTASYLLGQVLGVGAALISLLRCPEWRQTTDQCGGRHYLRQVLGYGLKAYASNVVTFLNYRANLFLVNVFLNPVATGLYVVALQFAEKLWLPSQAVSTVLLPKISQLSGNEEKRRRFTPMVARWTLAVTALAGLCAVLLIDVVVNLLMGDDFSEVKWLFFILLPGLVAWAPARVLANDIAARGLPEVNFWISVIVAVVNLTGNILLIPWWGVKGAAIATSTSYGLMLLLTLMRYSTISAVRWGQLLIPDEEELKYVNRINFFKK